MSSNTAFIVGFMGSGKAFENSQQRYQLGTINTIDLDEAVLRDNKGNAKSIEELFNQYGEEYFRINKCNAMCF